ncbi:hypothetical protein QBC43DRAFT_116573 [Cladorrhinum sp. PSN259]|nr:hypothetical protein QBC43DRAFT_116573 [Cladorrhinum sp. PSN259]
MRQLTAAGIGGRVLGEIEEVGLDEILASLRTACSAAATITTTTTTTTSNELVVTTTHTLHRPPRTVFPILGLDELMQRHFRDTTRSGGTAPPLAISGRYHELLYLLVATLISPPWEKTVSIVDFDVAFDPLRLLFTAPAQEIGAAAAGGKVRREDLEHVYVWRPERGYEGDVYGEVEKFMLYGNHASREREWWGTVVIGSRSTTTTTSAGKTRSGGYPAHVAVTAGRNGWMRVSRVEVEGFEGKGVEQALRERDSRQAAVEGAGWVGSSAWGEFVFGNK